jgi:hypothetical protein
MRLIGRVRVMGRTLFGILLGLLLFGAAPADASVPLNETDVRSPAALEGQPARFSTIFNDLETEFVLAAGLRHDTLDWSIAANGVDVLSELDWSSIDSIQWSLSNRSRIKRRILLQGHFNYAIIRNGWVRDSDYGDDGRTVEYSRSISETDGDDFWDISAGGGYTFFFQGDRLAVTPMVGLSYNKQNLRIQNGRQVISEDNPYSNQVLDNPPSIGPLSDQLNSTYFARWVGPWIGLDLRYRPNRFLKGKPQVALGMTMEIHWADYYGEGNWNLRNDLEHPTSFEHEAVGFGLRLAGDAVFHLNDHWAVSFAAAYQRWSTADGTDRLFSVRYGELVTTLNSVNWSSTLVTIGMAYHF